MNILKAIDKINKLSEFELNHCIQVLDEQIKYYKFVIKNYSPDKIDRYGTPYLNDLNAKKDLFIKKFEKRNEL